MEKLKIRAFFVSVCILGITIIAFGCEGPQGPAAAGDLELDNLESQPFDTRYHFNPQPEPPGQIFTFEATGDFDSRWTGHFRGDGFDGVLVVENLSPVMRGKTVHLAQLWTLHPPDPIQPPDTDIPPDPVSPIIVELKGTFNLANGHIVLNGIAKTIEVISPPANERFQDWAIQPPIHFLVNNTPAHVRGQFMTEGGVNLMFGELMFNPQPEPPGLF